ncbi:MAG: hypothetical protein KAS39_01845 [Actinomycetia bacterium]|nr:hypothetical protein [Actinomycetes bacterium]
MSLKKAIQLTGKFEETSLIFTEKMISGLEKSKSKKKDKLKKILKNLTKMNKEHNNSAADTIPENIKYKMNNDLEKYFEDSLSQYQSAKNYTITPEETLELSIGLLKKAISFYRKFKYNVTAENRPLIEKFNVDNRLILGDLYIYQARLMKN